MSQLGAASSTVDLALETPLGPVAAKSFGAAGQAFVLCVQGKSGKIDVVEEWYPTAAALAANGYHVVVPNLHSNPKTKPGEIFTDDLQAVLLCAFRRFGARHAILLGKSWGGGEALRFAARQPELVTHLVMVAPSLSDQTDIGLVAAPSLLFWAADDTVKEVSHAEMSLLRVQGAARAASRRWR